MSAELQQIWGAFFLFAAVMLGVLLALILYETWNFDRGFSVFSGLTLGAISIGLGVFGLKILIHKLEDE